MRKQDGGLLFGKPETFNLFANILEQRRFYMKRTFVIGLALIFGLALLAGSGPFENNAEAGAE